MLKNILKLDGVKELSKNEQRGVSGGSCDGVEQCCVYCHGNGNAGYYTSAYCSTHNQVGQTCFGTPCYGCM